MKIAVLDDVLMNSDQLKKLESLGTVQVFSGISADKREIVQRAKEADIILSGWTRLTGDVLDELSNLKHISLWATGYDYVDLDKASNRGIVVSNVPGYAKNAVAELAISLMLAVMRKIPQADQDVRKSKLYNWSSFDGIELSNKTLGILGTGAIGCRLAQIARGFDMRIIAYDPFPREEMVEKYRLEYVSYQDVFKESDIVSIHMPLLHNTANLITAKNFDIMKNSAILINTARAELIDQDELYNALKDKKIYGAGLDDIDLTRQSGLDILGLDNVVVTPHLGFNTHEAVVMKTDICIDNVRNYINSQPTNVVNPKSLKRKATKYIV